MASLRPAQTDVMTRSLMGFQPARVVLMDTSDPFDQQSGKVLCDALENTLCISANMAGPSRIPLLGIYMLTSYPEIILPLSCTKGNFVRLHSALTDIRTSMNDLSAYYSKDTESCLAQGIMEACKQYKRYVANMPQRIVSATVSCSLVTSDPMASPDMPTFDIVGDHLGGLVDVLTLECDELSLQRFFYGWLTDASSESEHLHLLLPPPSPADPVLNIKCDLAERAIPPAQLPFSDAYVLSCLSRESLCESVVWGLPQIVLPTSCWKIDWELLEQNQQNFLSLCHQLHLKDQVLLTQLVNPQPQHNNVTSWPPAKTAAQPPKPTGYFVLFPSDQRTLLVKSVLSKEHLLPSSPDILPGLPSEGSDLRIQASLSQVRMEESFNPLNYDSGLFIALKHSSLPKSAVDKARATKRKAELLHSKRNNNWDSGCSAPSPKSSHVAGSRLSANIWSHPLTNPMKEPHHYAVGSHKPT